jgi:hypothetical protein
MKGTQLPLSLLIVILLTLSKMVKILILLFRTEKNHLVKQFKFSVLIGLVRIKHLPFLTEAYIIQIPIQIFD